MLILKLSRKMCFGIANIGNISVLCDQQAYNFYSGIIQYLMNYHIYSLKSQVYLNLSFFLMVEMKYYWLGKHLSIIKE